MSRVLGFVAGAMYALVCVLPAQTVDLPSALARLAEEAEAFRLIAPQTISQETLRQKALKMPRGGFRIGAAASAPRKPVLQKREIVSEYGFGALQESPKAMHELRQVVSVDGRVIRSSRKAREKLALGLRSKGDRVKKRMLEEFAKHGLVGAASDFGQIILLFCKDNIGNYEFAPVREEYAGAEAVFVLRYGPAKDHEELTIFEGRRAVHSGLSGEIWLRKADSRPLRISAASTHKDREVVIRHEIAVEYAMTPHGAMLPVSVVHREYHDELEVTENLFRYAPFRKFAADSEIKFTELPEGLTAP